MIEVEEEPNEDWPACICVGEGEYCPPFYEEHLEGCPRGEFIKKREEEQAAASGLEGEALRYAEEAAEKAADWAYARYYRERGKNPPRKNLAVEVW